MILIAVDVKWHRNYYKFIHTAIGKQSDSNFDTMRPHAAPTKSVGMNMPIETLNPYVMQDNG